MKLEELVGKFIKIVYIDSFNVSGELVDLDKDLKVINLRESNSKENLFIPLSSIQSITELYT
ncbi:hypothetical protein ACULLL_06410 [Lysinibacillus irui]|uniref:hypothetical protein n=1 Tax=Lysinibacillus irui TaxID=2998077 RepID=UPI00404414C6